MYCLKLSRVHNFIHSQINASFLTNVWKLKFYPRLPVMVLVCLAVDLVQVLLLLTSDVLVISRISHSSVY